MLTVRLALRNLRHRPGRAALLLVTLTIATTTLSLALAVNETGDGPWDRVWRQTNGFHVSAEAGHDSASQAAQAPAEVASARAALTTLAREPEVAAYGGPWPVLYGFGDVGGQRVELMVQVREPAPSDVGQPLVTAGRWLSDDDGVVLEDGLAETLGVEPGDTVTIAGRRLPVRGTAMTVSQNRFPLSQPGHAWVNQPTGRTLTEAGLADSGTAVELRLVDPDAADAFVAEHESLTTGNTDEGWLLLETWRTQRADSHSDVGVLAAALLGVGILLAALTIATAAVLVAGRMAAQIRQVGTLKAVGVTPWQVTAVLLVEQLVLAAVATAVGLAAGTLLSPLVARSSVTLFGPPEPPGLTWPRVALVGGVAFAVVLLATVRPALRGARRSTLRSLATDVRTPRASRLGRLAGGARLPLPAVLGLRSAPRRPGRVLLNATGLALGVAMVVVAIALQQSLNVLDSEPQETDPAGRAALDALYDQVRTIFLAATGLLILLSVINALIVAVFAARDSARNHAVLRAVGATPRQTVSALVVAQLPACLLACAVGVPLGLALFELVEGGDLPPVQLSAMTVAAVAVAAPAVFAAVVSLPARLIARRPVAPLLTYE